MKRAGIKIRVKECGLIVHPDKGFLATSLDGIVYEVASGARGIVVPLHKTRLQLQRPLMMETSFAA